MGLKQKRTISLLWTFLLLATLDKISQSYVEGLRTLDKNIFGPKPEGTVKTIEALEVGDIIDCVDFWKQPAFNDPIIKKAALDNPLIKEYLKNDMVPSSLPSAFNKTKDTQPQLMQSWTKYGKCPKGTVPFRRTSNNGTFHRKYPDRNTHEYATVRHPHKAHGGIASFNLWKPLVAVQNEFSLSQMWALSGSGADINTVEAGWMVYPELFHDHLPRLFIFWTNDSYNTYCYNNICGDFVHFEGTIALGSDFVPSVYNEMSASSVIGFSRTQEGDWLLQVNEHIVGYYPRQKFTSLAYGADCISFGGEIVNLQLMGMHTSTAMGSGHFSREGWGKASFISHIHVKNDMLEWVEPNLEVEGVTRPECYDLTIGPHGTPLGHHFYFGGPGFSHRCL